MRGVFSVYCMQCSGAMYGGAMTMYGEAMYGEAMYGEAMYGEVLTSSTAWQCKASRLVKHMCWHKISRTKTAPCINARPHSH